ncbi:transporter substrate-binding domain-containing protein [Aliivibrio sp. S3MY1]|uniref:HD domain-containing phosphohydrolase n=1 Tax=unclassified Aliivibrio TaxID=2645654 RepID=UPI0023794A9E|nr:MULTISPECIES: HD domain-containing phosphohydrolase [unclassified Aliivibrio]MDD9194643.1 transporter substrate-binding domain-containing protein [Aliivibrio sp. S3MY1]MDD9198517.1 transporter substrate-binding domain-containing protein [Aliivibrio sp. S2MY1]
MTKEESEWLKHNKNFTFYNDNYDSRLFFIENGVQKGVYSYLVADINKKLNTNFTVQIEDIDVLHDKFNNLDPGLYFDFANTKERRENYFFVPTLYRVNTKVFFKDTENIKDLVSLNHKRIGLIDDWYSTTNFVNQYEESIHYSPVKYKSLNELTEALEVGDIDAFVADTQVITDKAYPTLSLPRLEDLYTSFAISKEYVDLYSILIKYFTDLKTIEVKDMVKKSREDYFIYLFKKSEKLKGLEISVGYGFNEFPTSYYVHNEYHGIAPTLFESIKLIFKDVVNFTEPTIGECNDYDILLSTFENKCITDNYLLTKPYYTFELSVFNKLEGNFISRIADVNYSTVGILKNAYYYDYVKNNTLNVKMVFFDTFEEIIKAVDDGIVDYAFGDQRLLLNHTINHDMFDLKIAGTLTEKASVYMAVKKEYKALFDAINLISISSDNERLIKNIYINKNEKYKRNDLWIWICVLSVCILIIALLLVRVFLAKKTQHRLLTMNESLIGSLEMASLYSDEETSEHNKRINIYSEYLSNLLKMPKAFVEDIRMIASLHDIGKIGIPHYILKKPGKLDPDEFDVMKQHVNIGYEIIKNTELSIITKNIVLYHHEKWNGKGYLHLAGKDIPIEARIVSIVDVYDALRQKRVYKEGFTHEVAIEIIAEERGVSFDPMIVDLFLHHHEEFRAIFENNQ